MDFYYRSYALYYFDGAFGRYIRPLSAFHHIGIEVQRRTYKGAHYPADRFVNNYDCARLFDPHQESADQSFVRVFLLFLCIHEIV